MRAVLIFFIITVVIGGGIVGFLSLKKILTRENTPSPTQLQEEAPQEKTPQEKTPQENAQKTPSSKEPVSSAQKSPRTKTQQTAVPLEPVSNILIDTNITAGPGEGEIIEDTNEVTFEFESKIFPQKTRGRISFETKIVGFDDDWKETSSKRRRITLPPGPKEYTFLVRAKIRNLTTDSTPAKRTFKINTSPYFGKVEISTLRAQSYNRSSLITLKSRLKNQEEKINITNWRLKGFKGEIIIPRGIKEYQSDATSHDIIVGQRDTLYLIGDSSPLGINRNFCLNKCFGYFQNYYKFYPSFSKSCPTPKLEEISLLSPYCQEFILLLPRCKIPDYSKNLRITLDSDCTSYLMENFSYNSCFQNHFKDKDFLKNYWYIYLNRDIISKFHDTLYLRDQNGLLVDKHRY